MLPQAPLETHCRNNSSIPHTGETLEIFLTDGHTKRVAQQFFDALNVAVKRYLLRLAREETWHPPGLKGSFENTGSKNAKVAILFSGGVDSMVTTAFAGWHTPFR